MTAKGITIRVLTGMLLVSGLAGQSQAQTPAASDLLARKPIQPNIKYSTPATAEIASCKVELIDYPQGANGTKPSGYVVRDAQGRIVRQFVDTTGKNAPNIVSYFLDGVEAYREIDTNANGKPDTFRYLGANGGRLGRDAGETGTIDSWEATAGLTAEEVSQELFTAIAARDTKRFQSLLVSDAEIAAIGLPATEEARVKARRDAAGKRFADTIAKLSLPATAKWVHLETALPHTVPFDAFNGKADSVRHKSAHMLVDRGDSKVDLVSCGEMILVGNGRMWKLIDGPGDMVDEQGGGAISPKIAGNVQKLTDIKPPAPGAGPAGAIKYHMDRAAILEEIVKDTQGADQEPWLKQLIDAYTGAGEQDAPGSAAAQRLTQWKTQIEKAAPGTPIHAYAAFRHLTVEYSTKIRTSVKPDDVNKTQAWWKESLEGYLKTFATAEDAPDAMMRLAMAHEFSGKDGEALAITVCEKLAQSFPQHPFAVKATGIVNRLKSEGQTLAIAGPRLGTNQQENVAKYAGQVVLVVYWASWAGRTADEAKQLVELEKKYAGKLVIVTVNLDEKAETATQAVTATGMPGIHIFQPGGIDANPLAVRYGILGPHAFLIGKDGKVANKNVQLPLVGEEIDRLTK
jgi:thiol-disulfide isomerase/thioredoxin